MTLSNRMRGPVLSENKQIQIRLGACFWIEHVGNFLQWYHLIIITDLYSPVRTIGTAMMLYLRFHLFNKVMDFGHLVGSSDITDAGCCGCMSLCSM
jgi:CTD kinase subunit beta